MKTLQGEKTHYLDLNSEFGETNENYGY